MRSETAGILKNMAYFKITAHFKIFLLKHCFTAV